MFPLKSELHTTDNDLNRKASRIQQIHTWLYHIRIKQFPHFVRPNFCCMMKVKKSKTVGSRCENRADKAPRRNATIRSLSFDSWGCDLSLLQLYLPHPILSPCKSFENHPAPQLIDFSNPFRDLVLVVSATLFECPCDLGAILVIHLISIVVFVADRLHQTIVHLVK